MLFAKQIHTMLSFLQNHPFAVEAFFERSKVLTFAVPKAQLEPLIPDCLTLDTLHDEWAFIAIALVQTKGLRPKGFPKAMGNHFFLIGYRIFVRYTNQEGKRLRGLYILKSETDSWQMKILGNLFTHYQYTTIDIDQYDCGNGVEITESDLAGFRVSVNTRATEVELPYKSPFADWKEARRFAGPLPFTFTYSEADQTVLIVEGVRENWTPRPMEVMDFQFDFLNTIGCQNAILANAFDLADIPYQWKKGKTEQWIRPTKIPYQP